MSDLNITGTFDWDPPINLKQEVDQLVKSVWEPSTQDFAEVAGNSVACDSFGNFLGAIMSEKPKSIGRINVFTHSSSRQIAFKGRLVPQTTMVDVMMSVNVQPGLVSLDTFALDALNNPGAWFMVGKSKARITLADIRDRFTANAIIFFYSCHSGGDPKLLQSIADTFQVMVDGFQPAIAYCPRYTSNPPSIDRKHIGLQACNVFQTTNFYELAPWAASKQWIISKKPMKKP